jgi:hypothetical protein
MVGCLFNLNAQDRPSISTKQPMPQTVRLHRNNANREKKAKLITRLDACNGKRGGREGLLSTDLPAAA